MAASGSRRKAPSAGVPRSGRLKGLQEADFVVPPSLARPKVVFLNCHYCGYAPEKMPEGQTCPKCGGHSWDRFSRSVKLQPAGNRQGS